jgi:hypothetical protein
MKTLLKISLLAALFSFLVALGTSNTLAAPKHPHYLHALSDLRFARALLQRPDGGALHHEEAEAVRNIDDAIGEIKRASIDDGKNIEDHEPVDPHWPWAGRLHKAREVIHRAIGDCSKEEDDPATRGLQMRILDHLHHAEAHIDEAIAIVH